MSESIKKNYLYSLGYQILNIIVPVFTIPYISRIFGAEGLGVYSYTSSIAQYFVLFALLGLNNYGTRAIAIVRDDFSKLNKTFSEIYAMQVVTGTLAVLFYYLYIVLSSDANYQLYFLILSLQVISAIFDVNWYFFGREKFQLTVIRNSVVKLSTLIAIFALVHSPEDLWLYLFIHVLSIFISAIVLWPAILKEVKLVRVSFRDVVYHFKPNLIMFIPVIAISVYKYMDKIMLGCYSITETGYYENVEKILSVSLGLITALGTVMLPRMSNLVAKKEEGTAVRYITKSMEFAMFLSIALACGMFAIAPEFVPIYFGKGFERCIVILQMLVVSAIITSWANVIRTQYLIPFKRDNIYVYSVIAGALTNFGLNIIFIRLYGAIGAVIGTISAESIVAIIQTHAARGNLECRKMVAKTLPYFAIGIIMVLSVRLCSALNLNIYAKLVLEIIVGALVYIGLSLLYKIKTNKDELLAFKISH